MKKKLWRHPISYTELAGWLFADLLLGLAVIGIASQPSLAKVSPKPSPSPTRELVEVLDDIPIKEEFQVNMAGIASNDASAKQQLQRQIVKSKFGNLQESGKKAWMVLIFSGGASTCQGSIANSEKAFRIFRQALPKLVTRETVPRPFIKLNCQDRNEITFEVYKYKYKSEKN